MQLGSFLSMERLDDRRLCRDNHGVRHAAYPECDPERHPPAGDDGHSAVQVLAESQKLGGHAVDTRRQVQEMSLTLRVRETESFKRFPRSEVLLAAQKNKIPVLDVPVLSKDTKESKIPLKKEFLKNLF